jgi:hypothetical protein
MLAQDFLVNRALIRDRRAKRAGSKRTEALAKSAEDYYLGFKLFSVQSKKLSRAGSAGGRALFV